jgi:hypothetical protein
MCLAVFPPTHRDRSPAPFVLPAVLLRLAAERDTDECEFLRPFRWRIRQGRLLRAIPRQDQLDSSGATESKRNSKITRADKIAIAIILTSSLEAGIKRHAAVNK